jgi:hypothetical protein
MTEKSPETTDYIASYDLKSPLQPSPAMSARVMKSHEDFRPNFMFTETTRKQMNHSNTYVKGEEN